MSTPPTYEQIRTELRRLLASGRYQVGDRLPTIRELTEQYNINGVQTVRSAYEALIDEGLVTARQGAGYFVAALPLQRLGLHGLIERAREAREDAEKAAARTRTLESELAAALVDHERVAVDALTAAARATILTHSGEERRRDFGEIALQVLAGVAANLGGIEELLSGRPGSWEAEIIRNAVNAIAPDDLLPRYRTEPIRITLSLDAVLADTSAFGLYDEAETVLDERYQALAASLPEPDDELYAWVYDQVAPDQDPVPRSEDAPAWSWEHWREGIRSMVPADELDAFVERTRTGETFTTLLIFKSDELAAGWEQLVTERDRQLDALPSVEDLDRLREREQAAYGAALAQNIQAAAAAIPDLSVPVEVTYSPDMSPDLNALDPLAYSLVSTALASTPSPADLPGTPLDRLEAPRRNGAETP